MMVQASPVGNSCSPLTSNDRSFFPLWFYTPHGRIKTHHVKDGIAMFELDSALLTMGYRPGGQQYLNYPPPHPRGNAILSMDTSSLHPGDLLVMVGRPWLDEEDGRIRVARGFTSFEEIVRSLLRRYFADLS